MPSIANQINWLTTQINNLLDLGCGCGECEAQDNKYKVINFGSAASPTDAPVDVSTFINALPLNATDYKTVLEDEIPLFVGYVSRGRSGGSFNKYIVKGYGKGVYGAAGTITLTESDLELIEAEAVGDTNYPPITDDPNAIVHDLGEIPSGDFLAIVNAGGPYVVTAGTNTYFEFTVSGDTQIWAFDGANGTYGSGGTTMLDTDVFLIYDAGNTTTNTLDEVTTAGNTTENSIHIGRHLSFYDNDTDTREWEFFSDGDLSLSSLGSGVFGSFNFSPLGHFSLKNLNGGVSSLRTTNLTALRNHDLPDKAGEIALVDDIIVKQLKVSFTDTEIKTLNSNTLLAVPSAGAGVAINILSATARLNFGTVAFDAPDKLVLISTPGGVTQQIEFPAAFINSGSTTIVKGKLIDGSTNQYDDNGEIKARIETGDPTVGDGSLDIYVTYELIKL